MYSFLILLKEWGRLQPGQALSGDLSRSYRKFSSETFLTNYNKLSNAAKEALFFLVKVGQKE
jgi:hypothetical protein